jgi:protein-disulfide isomerase
MSGSRAIVVVSACVVAVALSISVRRAEQRQIQMLEELIRLRRQLDNLPGANRVTISHPTGESLGSEDAPVTMVEFTDLQCAFCRQFHTTVFDRIQREYIDRGKLRYFTRHLPMDAIHPLAIDAARATLCAGEQGRFWQMRHALLANSATLTRQSFASLGSELHLDASAFGQCLSSPARVDARWQRDRADATAHGISATPTFFIGRARNGVLDGVRLAGAKPFAAFKGVLDEMLADSRPTDVAQ